MATPTRLPEFGNLALPLSIDPERRDTVVDADGSDVLLVNSLMEFPTDAEAALARLFTAAPDLLLAAEAVLALTGDESGDVQDAAHDALCSAIAKARGTEVAGG